MARFNTFNYRMAILYKFTSYKLATKLCKTNYENSKTLAQNSIISLIHSNFIKHRAFSNASQVDKPE